jgi:glutamate synthase (NADPH/NADH) small chain
VAVVGSGPSGLTVAGELAKRGHRVTVFEALHRPGGVLVFGIPEFRLPKEIVDFEIEGLRRLGVEIRTNVLIGATIRLRQLFEEEGYEALYLGLGAGSPIFMGIEGENLPGIYSANEFLTRVNLMQAHRPDTDTPLRFGDRVVVIGGGNTAMDAARTAVRLGAKEVTVVYRRSREEMPARAEEVRHAVEEGVVFEFLTVPTRFLADETGNLMAMECVRTQLGPPDESGRRRPVVIPGSQFTLPADIAVVAIGARPNPLVRRLAEEVGLAVDDKGQVLIDPHTGATNVPGLWAGGDIVGGEETVIKSMGDGRRAAQHMHAVLTGGGN